MAERGGDIPLVRVPTLPTTSSPLHQLSIVLIQHCFLLLSRSSFSLTIAIASYINILFRALSLNKLSPTPAILIGIMLPGFVESGYKRYKRDTSTFTTWLSEAGKECGYKSQALKGNRAPKLQDGPFVVPLKELVPLAKAIAKSESPSVFG